MVHLPRPLFFALLATAIPLSADAQPPTRQSKPPSKWEIDVHGGLAAVSQPTIGRPSLPKPGATRGFDVFFPNGSEFSLFTRSVPSWFFGDGSALINAVNADGHLSSRSLVPIDSMLTTAAVEHQRGGSVGIRIARSLGDRFAVAVSIDSAATAVQLNDAAVSGIEISRSSFETFWRDVFSRPGFTNQQVTAVAAIDSGSSRELAATSTLQVDLLRRGALTWFATVGGGVVMASDKTPQVALTGRYQFVVNGAVPFDESDAIQIRVEVPKWRGVIAWGGGWTWALSSRWGVRAELRAQSGVDRRSTIVSASPRLKLQTDPSKEIVLSLGAVPGVLFQNDSSDTSSVFRSPLNSSLPDFTTFSVHGWRTDFGFLVGLSRRF